MAYLRDTDYFIEASMGRIPNTSAVNKWGYNLDIDTATGQEIIAPWGGAFDPLTDIMSSADTFDIDYDQSVDGLGQTGALSLIVTYLDSSNEEQTAIHVLGNTGSDTTSFSGLGINRVVVYSNGGLGWNANDITFTPTTGTPVQALIPATKSVTQQCIYHTAIGYTLLLGMIKINALKISGGGSPRVTFRVFSWSRVTETRYQVFEEQIDTAVENTFLTDFDGAPLKFTGREVVYVTASSDTNNTEVNVRFSGINTITT